MKPPEPEPLATVCPKAGETFRIELGPYMWGGHVGLRFQEQTEAKELADSYSALIRLSKLEGTVDLRHFTQETVSNAKDGDSNYSAKSDMVAPRLQISDDSPLVLHRNEAGQISAIEIERIPARDVIEAFNEARNIFYRLSGVLSLTMHIPLRYNSILIRPLGIGETFQYIYHPFPIVTLEPYQTSILGFKLIWRYISLYAEAMTSNSDAYAFLCNYMVVDSILRNAGAIRTMHVESKSAVWYELTGNLPEDLIRNVDKSLVGMRYHDVREKFRDSYRDAIAHILPNAEIRPLDSASQTKLKAANVAFKLMASHLIRMLGHNVESLVQAGVNPKEIEEVMYRSGARRRNAKRVLT